MEGTQRSLTLVLILLATMHHAAPTILTKEPRTSLHIPEKIISLVNSHKNKPAAPTTQGTFQAQQQGQFQQYQPPSYPGPAPQGSGFQGQYQGQFQQTGNHYVPNGSPQNGGNFANQGQFQGQSFSGYPAQSGFGVSGQAPQAGFSQWPAQQGFGQGTSQQGGYVQGSSPQGGYGQGPQSYPQGGNTQTQGQYQVVYPQNQQTGSSQQFSGQGQFQTSSNSGNQESSGSQLGGGPNCICQAWPKPKPNLSDAPTANSLTSTHSEEKE